MIAMAMSSNPQILIADEPTTALDVTIQAQILHLLLDLQKKNGMSIILITHDLGVVAQTCKRVAVMCGGYVVEEGAVLNRCKYADTACEKCVPDFYEPKAGHRIRCHRKEEQK